MDYWARFAATGDPNDPTGAAIRWFPYDAAENILRLDDTISNLPGGYRNAQCDFLSAAAAAMMHCLRILSQKRWHSRRGGGAVAPLIIFPRLTASPVDRLGWVRE